MRVDGWSRSKQTDAMKMPADIMARRSTERIKKTIMTTAEHDQLSGMKRTEELKRGMAAAAAAAQRAQKEKQYAQESRRGGFGSGSPYMAGEKPQKTTNTAFSGGQRGGFGAKQVWNDLQTVNQKLAEARYDQVGYSKQVAAGEAEPVWQLVKQKKELDKQYSAAHPTPLRRAVNFVGDAMDAVVRASPAAAFSGMEQVHSYAEAMANRAAAWALRDLSNAQVLKLPSAKPVAEKMRNLADRMDTEVDYGKAQQWQEYYQSVMDEVMDGHSNAGKWVLDKVAAAGTAAFDKGVSLVTGIPVLPIMGVRAGGNAATRAHNKGATDAQALAIGLETAAVEMVTEKLFGGNPMYDTDVGVVNTLIGKLTGSESVMRVLDSTAFNIAAEGVEEVIAELGEAPFEGLVLNKTAKGTVSKERLVDAFLGGVFLAGMARINGYAMGTTTELDEAHTRHYAEILAEEAGKSHDSNVQRAATELQDQLDFGSAPTEKDVGHLVSVLDKAGETSVVDNVVREVKQNPLDTKKTESATAENAENGQVVEAEEAAADFDDLYEQMYPDSIDPYSKIRYNSDGTIVVTDDWTNRAHPRINAKYRPNAVVDVISHQGQHDRIIYDENGYFKTFVHGGDHNQPKYHQYGGHGEHAHDVIFDPVTWRMIDKIDRELTAEERIQNADIIRRGK